MIVDSSLSLSPSPNNPHPSNPYPLYRPTKDHFNAAIQTTESNTWFAMLRSIRLLGSPSIRCIHYSRVLRQEQPKDLIEAPNTLNVSQARQGIANEAVSGAPRDLATNRIVRIYQMAKPATQSGTFGESAKLLAI